MKQQSAAGPHRLDIDPDEQMIVDRVYSAVMERRLAPRTKLSEATLCETFGVGRMRVRRSLLLLASQGIVDLHSNRGAYIACPSALEAGEVFETRLMIETGLVRAMARGVSNDVIQSLRRHLEHEDLARKQRERTAIIRLSGEFHIELAKGHGNAVLTRLIRELVTRTSLIVGLFGVNRESTCPEEEHSQIVEAIAAGDGDRAEAVVRHHLSHIQNGLDLTSVAKDQPDLARILSGR
ncbi:MAG: GntR family transcriptional regulator [Hyphomicrobiales bacterium]|nr:GntR family transcriptional regulator [Hyphomicrobiales bacterium]